MCAAHLETLRLTDGEPKLLGAHLDRLARVPGGVDLEAVRTAIGAVLPDARGEQVLRIEAGEAGIKVLLRPLPGHAAADPELPIDVALIDLPGYSYPHKSTAREPHEAALARARASGATEALITDRGEVIEGATTNVFILQDDALITPPLGRCLPGVTRAALIARSQVIERAITTEELLGADEVLLTNALIGVRRVGRVDNVPVGGREPVRSRQLREAVACC
jgi:branched-subunit amino acid aminotransferase/4-amino-4-deoxychorismate lyase